jgi:hypothetical protein
MCIQNSHAVEILPGVLSLNRKKAFELTLRFVGKQKAGAFEVFSRAIKNENKFPLCSHADTKASLSRIIFFY